VCVLVFVDVCVLVFAACASSFCPSLVMINTIDLDKDTKGLHQSTKRIVYERAFRLSHDYV